jgi:3-methyladenine DNA glycosylase AlkC
MAGAKTSRGAGKRAVGAAKTASVAKAAKPRAARADEGAEADSGPKLLKDFFDARVVRALAAMLARAHPPIDEASFVRDGLHGLADLELTARARHLMRVMARHLPERFEEAIDVLVRSLGPEHATDELEGVGMAPFIYLPHVFFVSEYGAHDLERSLHAQYELTKRFTAEFSIRTFLERYPEATLARLRTWASDPNPHVRRLVSEGTRPRLPWAPRIRAFQRDPAPVLELLERLKDDPALLVRRSVANNLNDIGKDHPDVLVDVCRRWWADASEERRWLVRHALRSEVKRGNREALGILGFGGRPKVELASTSIAPKKVDAGGSVRLTFTLASAAKTTQSLAVDFAIHFVKANGDAKPKVFKLKTLELGPGASVILEKSVSFRAMTTRKHYPGVHTVELLVNGAAFPAGEFRLLG